MVLKNNNFRDLEGHYGQDFHCVLLVLFFPIQIYVFSALDSTGHISKFEILIKWVAVAAV